MRRMAVAFAVFLSWSVSAIGGQIFFTTLDDFLDHDVGAQQGQYVLIKAKITNRDDVFDQPEEIVCGDESFIPTVWQARYTIEVEYEVFGRPGGAISSVHWQLPSMEFCHQDMIVYRSLQVPSRGIEGDLNIGDIYLLWVIPESDGFARLVRADNIVDEENILDRIVPVSQNTP